MLEWAVGVGWGLWGGKDYGNVVIQPLGSCMLIVSHSVGYIFTSTATYVVHNFKTWPVARVVAARDKSSN